MKKRIDWRRTAWIGGAAFLMWMIAGILLAGRDTPPLPGNMPVTLRGGHVTGNHISTRSWSFDYAAATMSPDGTNATIEGIKNGVFYKKGKPYLSLSAQRISLDTQSLDFTAIGDVHLVELDPKDHIRKSFDSDFMQWSNALKLLTLPHPSIFRTGGQTLKVMSITVNFNTNSVQMGNVEGGVEVRGK